MPKLSIQMPGEDRAREVPLEGPLAVGRHPSQDLQLLDRLVSKRHARIERRRGNWTITDLGSRNGTFVNHRLISGPTQLSSGDEILLGTTILTYCDESPRKRKLRHIKFTETDDQAASIRHVSASGEDSGAGFLPVDRLDDPDALRNDYERLRMAHELSQELALAMNLDHLLEKLLDRLINWLGADRAVVLLPRDPADLSVDERDASLVPRCVRMRGGETRPDEEIRLSDTILRMVVDERSAVLSADAQVDSRFDNASSIIMQGVRSTMTVPMLHGADLAGVIHLDSLFTTNAFSTKDLQVLQTFATQAALAIHNAELVRRARREATTRQQLQRLLSPNVVEQVVAGDLEIVQGGQTRDVTVLFWDVRGFSRMAEEYPAQTLVGMLNEYFEIMVEIVFEYQGTLDKYMGDGFMALWGAPVDQPDHTWRAVAAALKMQRAMKSFNGIRAARGQSPVYAGIGIDTGMNVVGYMGSSKTLGYSVVGEGVNRASRLCSKALKGEVLVSESTYARTADAFRWQPRPPLDLRGMRRQIRCYRALGAKEDASHRLVHPATAAESSDEEE